MKSPEGSEQPVKGSEKIPAFPCSVCGTEVDKDDRAIQCDPIETETSSDEEIQNHWTHATCLENTHLFNGTVVPLSEDLFEFLNGLHFCFSCPRCSKDSLPLPLQLLEQGKLDAMGLKKVGAFTPEVQMFLEKTKKVKTRGSFGLSETDLFSPENVSPPPRPFIRFPLSAHSNTGAVSGESGVNWNPDVGHAPFVPNTQMVNPFVAQIPQNPTETEGLSTVLGGMMGLMQQQQQTLLVQQMQQQQDQMAQLVSAMHSKQEENKAELRAERERNENTLKAWQSTLETQQKANIPGSSTVHRERSLGGFSQLPKVEMPTFSGNILEWPSFCDMFHEMVDKHSQYSDVEKLHFLLTHLSGPAKSAVQNFRLETASYPLVVATLKERYDDQDKIRAAHIQALMNLGAIYKLDIGQLQKFQDTVDSHTRALIALAHDNTEFVDLQCSTIVPCLFEKLPILIRSQMFENGGKAVKTRLSNFREALKFRIQVQENIQGSSWVTKPSQNGRDDGRHQQHKSGQGSPRPSGAGMMAGEGKKYSDTPPNARGGGTASGSGTPRRQKKSPYCHFCKVEKDHRSFECPKYTTIRDRKDKLGRVCYVCLREGHVSPSCPTLGKYNCVQCKSENHNSALCPELDKPEQRSSGGRPQQKKKAEKETETPQSSGGSEPSQFTSDITVQEAFQRADSEFTTFSEGDEDVAMQTVVTTARNPENGSEMVVSILLDSGSKRTYVSEKVANMLQLTARQNYTRRICTFNSKETKDLKSGVTDVELLGKDDSFLSLTGNIVDRITGSVSLGAISMSKKDNDLVKTLKMADPFFNKTRQFHIDILIGNDFYPMLLDKQKLQLEKSGVILLDTKFGWVTSGLMKGSKPPGGKNSENLALFTGDSKPVVLEESHSFSPQIEDLWRFETIGIKDPKESDLEDNKTFKDFQDMVKFENGRVSVQWLKKEKKLDLPTNFPLALSRLKSLLKTLGKNKEYLEKYAQNFQDQLEKGVIEKVTPEMANKHFQSHYIPHHAVFTPQKMTTKMRVVFDASAKLNKSSKSLNECLYRGPNLLPDICGVIMRFRLRKIALISDIEKAFLQVSLQESERDVTRFLWLKDTSKLTLENNLEFFRFARVPFGVKTSPFLLAGAVWFLLDRAEGNAKFIAEQIRENIYVDNLITGVNSATEAEEFYHTAKDLFAAGSMNLREWTSNSEEVMNQIPEKDRVKGGDVKVLGVLWDTKTDQLSICANNLDSFSEAKTKRQILGCMASIFDPLGLLNCLRIRGMIFLQEIWKEKVEWDDQLKNGLLKTWKILAEIFQVIPEITIPRQSFEMADNSLIDILCFCDASKEAYSAAIYLRCENTDSTGKMSLVFTKARLIPISGLSVPRAELMAVLIGTRCMKFVEKQLGPKIRNRFLWTDSQVVLGWIRKESSDQGVFVTNRIAEILKSDKVTFLYIRTDQNPADLATKSREKSYRIPWELWWEGPEWLKQKPAEWPTFDFEPIKPETPILLGGGSNLKNGKEMDLELVFRLDFDKSFIHLVRVTAWALRFVQHLKQKVESKANAHAMHTRSKGKISEMGKIPEKIARIPPLETSELKIAQNLWMENVQRKSFPDLFTEKFGKSNLAQCLKVKLGDNNILRCHGRLGESDVSFDAKYPILLPSNSEFTKLIVLTFHRRFLHAGVNHTLAQVRSLFWIPKGRVVVSKILRKCAHCARIHAKPFAHPPMPNLPKERVSEVPPFTFTGVDFFGPLYCRGLTKNEGEMKVWVALFTCFTIRAVHLELVTDMTAQTFLGALRRFVARRGKPRVIFSDNALQFKMTKTILKRAENNRLDTTLQNHAINEGINWKFIPELSPWAGGVYERMVGVTKSSLKKALGKSSLNFEQLRTVLTEVEEVVNSRPITFVNMTENDSDLEILTPQKFLSMGRSENMPILPEDDPSDPEFMPKMTNQNKLMQTWKQGQFYLSKFWNLWRDNYLLNLRERHASDRFPKIKSETFRAPRVGEIVLVKENNLPRGLWKLGRVFNLHESRDSLIRSAEVKIVGSRNSLTRPVSHLFPLEIGTEVEIPEKRNSEVVKLACDPSLQILETPENGPTQKTEKKQIPENGRSKGQLSQKKTSPSTNDFPSQLCLRCSTKIPNFLVLICILLILSIGLASTTKNNKTISMLQERMSSGQEIEIHADREGIREITEEERKLNADWNRGRGLTFHRSDLRRHLEEKRSEKRRRSRSPSRRRSRSRRRREEHVPERGDRYRNRSANSNSGGHYSGNSGRKKVESRKCSKCHRSVPSYAKYCYCEMKVHRKAKKVEANLSRKQAPPSGVIYQNKNNQRYQILRSFRVPEQNLKQERMSTKESETPLTQKELPIPSTPNIVGPGGLSMEISKEGNMKVTWK